ncbi:MAG: hypothetical protein ACTHNU_09325 [Gaiellales bacterium]
MTDAAAVLRATAEAAQMARVYGCVIEVKIGKTRGQGEVYVKIVPTGEAQVELADAPTVIVPGKPADDGEAQDTAA